MIKNGLTKSIFHHVFSDHEITLQSWICSNKTCRKSVCESVKSKIGSAMHIDLQKIQAELGAQFSFKKSTTILDLFSKQKRSINNHQRILRMVKTVGAVIDNLEPTIPEKSKQDLVVQIDGGYVHHWHDKGSHFEILVGKVYSLDCVVEQSKGHSRITDKSCFSSAFKGKESPLQAQLLKAANEQGLTQNTCVTALFDGAANCSNAVKILEAHSKKVTCILDWFHIAMKLKVLENCLLNSTHCVLQNIKKYLWKGNVEAALKQLLSLVQYPLNETGLERLYAFYDYIKSNKTNMVDYNSRHHAGLPYTSHVAESTVEHLLNQRLRKKQKMQWGRSGADNVLQVRTRIASQRWEHTWEQFIADKYKIAA